MVDLDMDDTLLQVTFHSISNRITPKYWSSCGWGR
jgi:hypothetical protein